MGARKARGGGKQGGSGGSLWPAKLGIFVLRVYTGAVFLSAVNYKLFNPPVEMSFRDAFDHFVKYDYLVLVRGGIDNPPVLFGWEMTWFSSFLETVMVGGNAPYIFGGAILAFEALLGLSLVLGACTRLMATLGVFMMLGFSLAKGLNVLTVRSANYSLLIMLLAIALLAAGRIWGVDSRLRHRLPSWIS